MTLSSASRACAPYSMKYLGMVHSENKLIFSTNSQVIIIVSAVARTVFRFPSINFIICYYEPSHVHDVSGHGAC
jgi:hypothetical protein